MGSTAERMSDFTIFSRVFITSDVRATGRRSLRCFGADVFGTGITVDVCPERRFRMLVYEGLEEVSKNTAELVSTELQSAAISTIRTRTLVYIEETGGSSLFKRKECIK